MANKRREKILAYTCLFVTICLSIVLFAKFLVNTSVGADNQKIIIETNLDKYINYEISDQDKGTLIQYNVRLGIEYLDEEYVSLKSSELAINLNQIDGKYPYAVKVIAKTTELTNGKTENFEENYEYDSSTGTITINTSNQDENSELIDSTQPSSDAKDEYVIIAYYDTYTEQEEERELDIIVGATVTLSVDDRKINQENEFKGTVKGNIGELTSVTNESEEIYNGYIKSNIINGTNYDTEYKETAKIMVSKKEVQQKIELKESNSFERVYQNSNGEEIVQEFASNGDLVYKSTKIKQQDIKRLLGENAVVEILDGNSNLIATIDQNTQFAEDGSVVINYENEPEFIIIKTSEIKSEGILPIENTKKIKNTMKNMDYNKIKTAIEIIGTNEETVTREIESEETGKIQKIEEIIEKQAYVNNYENIIDIKESTNNINIDISNKEWTNQYQNEVTFNVYMSTNSTKDNMLKNPSVKIELPREVEKVILGESSVVYANGLELQDPYLETNENGNIVIAANLVGTQTNYDENTLGLVTDVKISATVILKKDIENTTGNVNLTYTNQYNVNGRTEIENRSTEIKIASYKEENIVGDNPSIKTYANTSLLTSTVENIEGLTVEVTPVKGDTVLKDGDTVYEGEFIKYNIKVTNTSDKQIDNIKVVGSIPEGTTYGELEADYYTSVGEYQYNFDDAVTEKTIEIGSLDAGKSITQFYEVQVNDLPEKQNEQQIITNIKVYAGTAQVIDYNMTNVIKKAEIKVFLGSFLGTEKNAWDYTLFVSSDEIDEVTATLKVPKEFNLEYILIEPGYEGGGLKLDLNEIANVEGNVIAVKVQTNKKYLIAGDMNRTELGVETEGSELELTAVANVEIGNVIYTSNENRILYGYDSVSILMTSENEGEEVKYGDEINYEIVVTNTGKNNLQDQLSSCIGVHVIDFLPEDVEPIKITYNNYKEEKANEEKNEDGQTESFELTGIYNEEETVIEDIGVLTDEEGNILPNVDLYLTIPYGKSVNIKVETTAGLVFEKTKIENSATVSGILEEDNIKAKTSNTITHTILPYDYEENEEPDTPDNPDIPDNPDRPDEPNNPSDNIEKYSISGVAWIDENEDGKRQTSEKLLSKIPVMLVNSNNSSQIKERTTTDSNGNYHFSELEQGNYIVIFNYDIDTYSVTEYQKSGVSNSANSDAISKEIILMGTQTKVGITDTITLNASVSNIDIGLIKNKICDLKLDKYISKVQVKTTSGTKEYTYDNNQLAKVEIKSKEIQGATVVVTYKIVVTNEGELPVSAVKVVDYIPDGFNFSSELNKNWTMTNNGEVVNITNQSIKAGESTELALILTKSMTSNSTGTFTNMAEIGDFRNSLGTSDADSTPGNKVETEDDFSKAELIISVSTGAIIYISIGILLVALAGVIIFLSCKYGVLKIGKIFLFGAIVVVTLISGKSNVDALSSIAPSTACFTWNSSYIEGYYNDYGSTYFEGDESTTGDAYCIDPGVGVAPAGSQYNFKEYGKEAYIYTNSNEANSDVSFTLTKRNDLIETKKIESSRILLGPFKFYCSTEMSMYFIHVYNTNKETISIYGILNENLEHMQYLSGKGEITFYLLVNAKQCRKGIANVKLSAYKGEFITNETTVYRKAQYVYSDSTQDVETINTFKVEIESSEDKELIENHKTIIWTNFNGVLSIIKQDAEFNLDLELGDLNYTGTIDSDDVHFISDYLDGTYEFDDEDKLRADVNEDGIIDLKDITALQDKIIKIEESKLEGVKFFVKNSSEKYVKQDSNGNITYVSNKDNATLFKTDSHGEILINNLKPDSYTVIEESNPNYGYTVKVEDITKKLKSGSILTITRKNQKQTGNLQIKKKDYNNQNKLLEGVSFKIKNKDGEYIIATDSKGEYKGEKEKVTETIRLTNMTPTTKPEEATVFTTNGNGEINILNMLTGDYFLEEISVGNNFGYEVDGKYIYYNYTNDDDDKTQLGEGKNSIPFTIKRQSSKETGVSTDTANITYKNKLNVYNKKKYIKLSGYAWEEAYKGKQSSNDGLWTEDKYTDPLTGEEIKDMRLNNIEVILFNKDGEEIDHRTTGGGDGSYLFGDYINEKEAKKILIKDLEEGAYIQFYYNGLNYETVGLTGINNNGKVSNGNTAKEFIKDNDKEVSTREKFNNNYATIENNTTLNKQGKTCWPLSYNYDGNVATLQYDYSENIAKDGYIDAKYPIFVYNPHSSDYADNQFIITSRTETNLNPQNEEEYRLLGQNKTIDKILEEGLDTIENINLGLYEREQPDISLVKDLHNVELSINDKSYVYLYRERTKETYKPTPDDLNVGVKYKNSFKGTYSRAIYESDIRYQTEKHTDELEVYVTYVIRMNNESSSLATKVNSIVDYYDSNYEFCGAYRSKGDAISGEIGDEITSDCVNDKDYYNENNTNYNKLTINNNTEIAAKKSSDIYVKFKVKKEKVKDIVNEGELELNNYAEITSYSTFDKDENKEERIYAGIDKDSNPGNATQRDRRLKDKMKREDDTDSAPVFKLILGGQRTITGTVFLDESTGGVGLERKGNGQYNDGEKGISNVTVTLTGITTQDVAQYLDMDGEIINAVADGKNPKEVTYTTNTDDHGNFEITKFIPGDYTLTYTWGDNTYIAGDTNNPTNVNDYKGTIVDKNSYNKKGTGNNQEPQWYKDDFKKKYPNIEWNDAEEKEIRVSDATDNYNETRLSIDKKTKQITDTTTDEIKQMDSTTPTMAIEIEYEMEEEKEENTNPERDIPKIATPYVINSVDFGIVERPKQIIEVSKQVKTVKITLANGQTIVDAEVIAKGDVNGDGIVTVVDATEIQKYLNNEITLTEEQELKADFDGDGNITDKDWDEIQKYSVNNNDIKYQLKGVTKGVSYMGPSKNAIPRNGYLKVEIDNELIQGSTIEIGYAIIVKNNSEVDYDSKDYYQYGKLADNEKNEEKIITITPTKVYDYLDKNNTHDEKKTDGNNDEWKIKATITNEKKEQTEKTVLENYFSYMENFTIVEDGKQKTVNITGFTSSYEEYYKDIKEWSVDTIKTRRTKRLENKKILENGELENILKPGEFNEVNLCTTKVLANSDEIELNNEIEITEVKREQDTGRKVTPTSSTFYDKGETVTVTQATGENRDYASIIILVISSFILLGTGIVFIKKKVLG